ncbi:WD40-repeat-containing domain [Phytophthora cactorum]|nr:WD40-repeat-containing domain [Phytophthora cactorum]
MVVFGRKLLFNKLNGLDTRVRLLSVAPPSPSHSKDSPNASSSRICAAPAVEADNVEKRLLLAQRLACQHRAFAHRTTREENAFAFRGYAAKRRRRHVQPITAIESAATVSSHTSPLFEDNEEIPNYSTADSDLKRMVPLGRQNRHRFIGHSKAINELQWHPNYPQVFLSASMDATVRVWKTLTSGNEKCQRVLTHHSLGVKTAKWSPDGRHILSGGYDGLCCFVDAETGQTQNELRRPVIERITTVHFHPTEPNSLLLGTDKGHIYSHDLREKAPVATFTKSFGDVHDLLFLGDDGQRFVSSAGVMRRDASNQTLLVWDWRSTMLLYDRLDTICWPIRAYEHIQTGPQCSGNYASLYSTHAPYKRLKGPSISGHRPPLRFSGGHEVEGFKIQCSFSRDGELWASGDANGRVVIYRTSGKRKLMESFQLYGRRTGCICAEFISSSAEHLDSERALLTGSSDGDVDLFQ